MKTGNGNSLWAWRESLDAEMPTKAVAVALCSCPRSSAFCPRLRSAVALPLQFSAFVRSFP